MCEEKKLAFVSGASRGIGKAIVKRLGKDGFVVGFNYINSKDKAEEFVRELEEDGIEAFCVRFDVCNFEEVSEAFSSIEKEYGKIDVLINNAGITRDKLFIKMKEDDFDSVINTNLKGVFNCTKQVAKSMTKKRFGRIINMSSLAGIVGNFGQTNYSASKAGVIGFTKTLATELGPYGITVNAVAPGFIETDMTDALPDKIKEKILDMVPLRRNGNPDDIAGVVSFLASEDAGYITGQVISVDGGLSSI